MSILLDSTENSNVRSDRFDRRVALEVAGRMAADPARYRVSQRHPCPICGRAKWCLHSEVDGVTLCPRQDAGALLDRNCRPIRMGGFGFVHATHGVSLYIGGAPSPRRTHRRGKRSSTSPEVLRSIAAQWAAAAQDRLPEAAAELGLPVESLRAFGLGAVGNSWTWSERTATGEICGLGTRDRKTGEKSFRPGGHRGIILSTVRATDRVKLRADIIARGQVVLPEGFSDSVVVHAMGEVAVGRPSVSGGIPELAALLESLGLAPDVRIVLLGENDPKPDGSWPGRDQAAEAAGKLGGLLGRQVEVLMPPPEYKDVRQAWQGGITTWGEYSSRATRPADPWAGLEVGIGKDRSHPTNGPSCAFSPVSREEILPGKKHTATNPQGDGYATARYPQAARERFASSPANCPKVRWVGGERGGSPALIAGTCGRRTCPTCGEYWKLQTYKRFHSHVVRHDGQLYHATVDDGDWRALVLSMRRQAKRMGLPLRYVAVRGADEMSLIVFASVPVGRVAQPVEKAAALGLLMDAIDQAPLGPRPVSASREWGRLPRELEVEKVPFRCSPDAFRKTAEAWGSGTKGSSRFLVCEREGLFCDESGKIDVEARSDFWREGLTRDLDGNQAGDDFHRQQAAEREARRRRPPPPTAECQHDGPIDETPTRDGYLNRTCRACGEALGCRRVDP